MASLRIGPMARALLAYVAAHPGCEMQAAVRAVSGRPHSPIGWRLVNAGLLTVSARKRPYSNYFTDYHLFPAPAAVGSPEATAVEVMLDMATRLLTR